MSPVGGGTWEVHRMYGLAVKERSVEAVTGRSRMIQVPVIEACNPVRFSSLAQDGMLEWSTTCSFQGVGGALVLKRLLSTGQERVEKLLRNFLEEHRRGLWQSLIISDATVASAEEGNEATWQHIGLELEAFGITPKIVQENRVLIVQWIEKVESKSK
ncbi:hypothetical protein N7G274_004838 [Stereocaulon virgatum]|uniref:Uncharacterized protein n=1 Tax=Stereocaulon virgatum TaxID=373712 RepID=A0ABR4ACC6_9LECA